MTAPPKNFWTASKHDICWETLDDYFAIRTFYPCCLRDLPCQRCGEDPFNHAGRDLKCLYSAGTHYVLNPKYGGHLTSVDIVMYMRSLPEKPK